MNDLMKNSRKLLKKRYPQNYILQNPLTGSVISMVFIFSFMVIYQPLKGPAPHLYSYAVTMAIYSLGGAIAVFSLIKVLKRFNYFSGENWTFGKEIISLALILSGMSITIYLMGFIFEPPAQRWNIATFLDSCKSVFLIGGIPFTIFMLLNYRHLLVTDTTEEFESDKSPASTQGELIRINSRLKKEDLSFYPEQFIYAESEGNYVAFYMNREDHIRKEIIRNSITDIERQLSRFPYITRVHRAFIVNLNKVHSKKGSTLGYRLKLSDTESEIPVSRQNVQNFDLLLKQYKVSVHNKNMPPVTIPGSRF